MEYIKLTLGGALLLGFTWILVRNSKRTGLLHIFGRVDTLVGIAAGVYLIVTAAFSLFS